MPSSLLKLSATSIVLVCCLFANAHAENLARVKAEGAKHYRSLCASCHGADGRGAGPVAPSLAKPPPDLTKIAERFDNHFPWEYVWLTIDGRAATAAHGPREMPVWGNALYYSHRPFDAAARGRAEEQIKTIVAYLESIQRIASK